MSDKGPVKLPDSGLELDWGDRHKRGADAPSSPPEATPTSPMSPGHGQGAPQTPARGGGPPGSFERMPQELQFALEPLFTASHLQARQERHLAEMIVGWEQANKYVVEAEGRTLYFVGETGGGLLASLARNFWVFRTIQLEFQTPSGTVAMRLSRPWRLFFAKATVESWDGQVMGILQQRFAIVRRRIDVLTPAGNELASIVGPLFKPWTFEVHQKGQKVATIRKKWSGFGRELLTDADNFGIEFHAPLDARLRQLLVGATMLVDLLWFEDRHNRNDGVLGLLGR